MSKNPPGGYPHLSLFPSLSVCLSKVSSPSLGSESGVLSSKIQVPIQYIKSGVLAPSFSIVSQLSHSLAPILVYHRRCSPTDFATTTARPGYSLSSSLRYHYLPLPSSTPPRLPYNYPYCPHFPIPSLYSSPLYLPHNRSPGTFAFHYLCLLRCYLGSRYFILEPTPGPVR